MLWAYWSPQFISSIFQYIILENWKNKLELEVITFHEIKEIWNLDSSIQLTKRKPQWETKIENGDVCPLGEFLQGLELPHPTQSFIYHKRIFNNPSPAQHRLELSQRSTSRTHGLQPNWKWRNVNLIVKQLVVVAVPIFQTFK